MDKNTCNPCIKCSVTNCAYHGAENCCSLTEIKVGTCDCSTPTQTDGTECCSFKAGEGTY